MLETIESETSQHGPETSESLVHHIGSKNSDESSAGQPEIRRTFLIKKRNKRERKEVELGAEALGSTSIFMFLWEKRVQMCHFCWCLVLRHVLLVLHKKDLCFEVPQ